MKLQIFHQAIGLAVLATAQSAIQNATFVPGTGSAGQITSMNGTFGVTGARNVRYDRGVYGLPVEEFHYYYDQWPIGIAVSKKGRVFASYTRGNYSYTLGEIINTTAEAPYPNSELNTPSGGLSTSFNGIPFGSNSTTHFINVQALYVTPDDTLWVLDTGRPTINESTKPTIVYAQPGGPKLIAMNLTTNTISRTYTFPASVHFPDSYLNDLRFDMRPNVTASGGGIAYLVDSSNEGRNGFIVVDLGTGESWRALNQHPSTLPVQEDVPSYNGMPFYVRQPGTPLGFQAEGLDGIELSLYGDIMYYSALTSKTLYSIETKYLRLNPANDTLATKKQFDNVKNLGQRGGDANGFAGDSLGNVYMLMPEQNAVYIYNSTTHTTTPYLRDPRILWPDGAAVGFDGYIYININQLPYQPIWNNGVDKRSYPGLIVRARLADGAGRSGVLGK